MPIACDIVYGMPVEFPERLERYCSEMQAAVRANKHHDQRLSLLLNFLRDAFSIETEEIELQHKVKAGSVRGRIDAFFRCIIFEMKCNLERERKEALAELLKYFESQREPHKHIGVVSDGTQFEVYHYSGRQILQVVRSFAIEPDSPALAFQELDELFATRPRVLATSQEICHCFGLRSVVLSRSLAFLRDALESVSSQPGVRTKFREWDTLLAKVYGARTGDQDMFLKHTYMALLSRCIVVEVLFSDARRDSAMFKGLIDGAFFRSRNIQDLAEEDFFAWGLGNDAEPILIELIANLFRRLDVFRFDELDQDLLKMLYQELVEPADRHSLGEYYTPDWLAQLTLDEIDYRGGRLLDPACGSGTFLYFAIRRLRQTGRTGASLVSYALENVIGIDVHPLAVLMAKANILLALGADAEAHPRLVRLPVYLADTLMTGEDVRENSLHVLTGKGGAFRIPFASLEKQKPVDELIDTLVEFANRATLSKEWEKRAEAGFFRYLQDLENHETVFWRHNFRHMVKMIRSGRDTVWAFILKNAYRPVYLRKQKCRYIVGNPPWLSYRYIQDSDYKNRIRNLTFDYGLLKRNERKLFTQIDTSTLFYIHCEKQFLEAGGTIAFVMPKSTIVPSQQHAAFQQAGFSRIHDFSAVTPLFNVRSCLIIREAGVMSSHDIPVTEWTARFSEKNPKIANPRKTLRAEKSVFSFTGSSGPLSPYHGDFRQGATIVPRCFWFVEHPEGWPFNADAPYLETTEAALRSAKEPWKVNLRGNVEARFLFATLLADGLLPFGVRDLFLAVLPLVRKPAGSLVLLDQLGLLSEGALHASDWMKKVEEIWSTLRRDKTMSLGERLDYQNLLTIQRSAAPYVVLYNRAGTNIAAAIIRKTAHNSVRGVPVSGFVADNATYFFYAPSLAEAHYLIGVLNSETVNAAIKPFQTQGLWGERDIHRRPFEVCAIPRFDPNNDLHRRIAKAAHEAEDALRPYLSKIEGPLARARATARQVTQTQIAQLDSLTEQLLGETARGTKQRKRGNPEGLDLLSLLL